MRVVIADDSLLIRDGLASLLRDAGVDVVAQTASADDLLLKIAARIEAKALARLSHRLAPVPNAPKRTVKELAFHPDIEVARPILVGSERLDESDLLDNARTQSQEHLLEISERKSLSEAITDVLVERGDREVVRSVATNTGARFSNHGFRRLVTRSTGDDVLSTSVGSRRDIPRAHFLKLIERASASVREKLTALDGTCVVEHAPPEAMPGLDVWGEVGPALEAMRRLKRELDPGDVLNPGRYVGGI